MLNSRQKLVRKGRISRIDNELAGSPIKNETNMALMLQEQTTDECHCACHRAGAVVMHILECCRRCPKCARSIKTSRFSAHALKCRPGSGMRERDISAPPPA
jgi:hypothetical protein